MMVVTFNFYFASLKNRYANKISIDSMHQYLNTSTVNIIKKEALEFFFLVKKEVVQKRVDISAI